MGQRPFDCRIRNWIFQTVELSFRRLVFLSIIPVNYMYIRDVKLTAFVDDNTNSKRYKQTTKTRFTTDYGTYKEDNC